MALVMARGFVITAPKLSLENPSYSHRSGARSFLALSCGPLDEDEGHWVLDEDTGEAGFLDLLQGRLLAA